MFVNMRVSTRLSASQTSDWKGKVCCTYILHGETQVMPKCNEPFKPTTAAAQCPPPPYSQASFSYLRGKGKVLSKASALRAEHCRDRFIPTHLKLVPQASPIPVYCMAHLHERKSSLHLSWQHYCKMLAFSSAAFPCLTFPATSWAHLCLLSFHEGLCDPVKRSPACSRAQHCCYDLFWVEHQISL